MKGPVKEFSRRSRREMLNYLNSLNKEKIKTYPLFLTLTYPDEFPRDPKVWKRDFNQRWCRRIERKYGRVGMLWRLELQSRKSGSNVGQVAPHYHVLLFFDEPPEDFRRWLSQSWYESCGTLHPNHLRAGTNVKPMESWGQTIVYLAKYMAKPELLADGYESPGRFWGKRCPDLLPVDPVTREVSYQTSIRLRRALCRLARQRPRGRHRKASSVTAYVSDKTVERLLEYYC